MGTLVPRLDPLPWSYIGRKLLLTIPLLLGVVSLVFLLVELSPGSVVDKFVNPSTTPEIRSLVVTRLGLDQPAWYRYVLMLRNLAVFEFGRSLATDQPVFSLVRQALPNTLLLSSVTLIVVYPLGCLLGAFQAVRRNEGVDTTISISTLTVYSMPAFWLGLMLQLFAATTWLGAVTWLLDRGLLGNEVGFWLELPLSGMCDAVYCDDFTMWEYIADVGRHLLLPGVAMGVASAAGVARYMRSSLLEVLQSDYVRTARAKGLTERSVIGRHALRNALLPILTLLGLSLPYLFSGSVIIEYVFAWPGMGRLIVDAIFQQDLPVVIACFYVYTLFVVAGSLFADIACALVDPRVRLT